MQRSGVDTLTDAGVGGVEKWEALLRSTVPCSPTRSNGPKAIETSHLRLLLRSCNFGERFPDDY